MLTTRRDMIRYGAMALAGAATSDIGLAADEETEVNDIHSQLNRTRVARVVRPQSLDQLRAAILDARREGLAISITGSRRQQVQTCYLQFREFLAKKLAYDPPRAVSERLVRASQEPLELVRRKP